MLSDGRKLIDSFLFSEPHEKEVLLAKMMAGDDVIDEYVAIEGAYTFRGEYKGCHLAAILDADSRFDPFRDRITVLSNHQKPFLAKQNEASYFEVEFDARERSRVYLLEKYEPRDLVTSSDVDEMLDFSDPWRRQQLDHVLLNAAVQERIAWVKKLKFWYDFDNVSDERVWLPAGPLGLVRDCWQQRRAPDRLYIPYYEPFPLAFEYSFCFPRRAAIMRKLSTYSHDGFSEQDVEDALRDNRWVKASSKGERPGERGQVEYFQTVEVTAANSTRYVRENLRFLKTNNVVGR